MIHEAYSSVQGGLRRVHRKGRLVWEVAPPDKRFAAPKGKVGTNGHNLSPQEMEVLRGINNEALLLGEKRITIQQFKRMMAKFNTM